MVTNKHITKIAAIAMSISVGLCLLAILISDRLSIAVGGAALTMEYESKLFNTDEILQVNIIMDDDEWQNMLDNAMSEEYYRCNVEINGETFYQVGIRPKGNTSLTSIASDPDTDRYSLKLEFDLYVDGQTCYGLDKLVLNNNYADATNMKEALIYDMFQYLDTDASLYNYAKISVNGEYWGVYLALEAVEDSFILRNYGTEIGKLYKPEGTNMGNMGHTDFNSPDLAFGDFDFENADFGDFDFADLDFSAMSPPELGLSNFPVPEDFAGEVSNFPDSKDFSRGFSLGGNGADLNYTDNNLESYSTIWDGEVTKTSDSDHKRVVKALENISEGVELETYANVENLLKYMAVHVFSVNDDSLSGFMAHNYYLYESDGQLNILPWDYNLAFGGMNGNNTTDVVNSAIDQAFSGTDFFDTLMENETYHAQYYSYLQQIVDEYINGGGFDEFYHRVRSQIDELAETDPTSFYTYDEYMEAVETLYELVKLRGESISGQLDGSIPSTTTEQRNCAALVDASYLDLSVMGNMDTGRDKPENFNPSQAENRMIHDNAPPEAKEAWAQPDNRQQNHENNMESKPDNMENRPDIRPINKNNSSVLKNIIQYGIGFAVLIAAYAFAKIYRKRPYR